MSSGKGETDPTWTLAIMLLLLWGFAWLAWYYFAPQIMEVERWVRFSEVWLVWPFDSRVHDCATWLRTAPVGTPPPRGSYFVPSMEAFKAGMSCFRDQQVQRLSNIEAFEYYDVTPTSLGVVSSMINGYLRWPVVIMCVLMGWHAIFITNKNKFKVRFTLESFIRAQAKMWPVISPVVNFNPSKHSARVPGAPMPAETPIFAEAFSPEEWLSFHRIPINNGIPDKEAVRRALMLQLGVRWTNVDDLPIHMLALFAAFALKGVQKRDESDDLLGRIAQSWSPKDGFKPSGELRDELRKIARDPDIGGRALTTASQHAFRVTALLGTLKWARFAGGVLAPAHFLWLRAEDRNLWYALNNLGRRSFHSEGAGAMAHFMAETIAKKPLAVPRVDTAYIALQKYVSEGGVDKVVIPSREIAGGAGRKLQVT